MAKLGYEYLVEPPAAGVATTMPPARVWELPNPDLAATDGYSTPGSDETPELTPEPNTSSAYEAALWGKVVGQWEDPDPPTYAGAPVGGDTYDGCLPTARTAIVGDGHPEQLYLDHDLSYRLNNLLSEASDRLFIDPAWLALEAEWVGCMRASGYEYDSIFGPVSAAWGGTRPTAVEIQTAVADATCKAQLGVADLGQGLYERLLADLMDERSGDLIEVSREIEALQARATAALNSG